MRLSSLALLGVALTAAPCLAQQAVSNPTSSKQSPSDLVAKARTFLDDNDPMEAVPLLDAALRAKTDLTPYVRAVALYLRGVAFYRENNAFAALRDLRAAASEPQLPDPMRKSATSASTLLTGRVSSVVGGVYGEGYSYQVGLTPDDLRQREKMIEEGRSDTDPDTRAEAFATLAHEYASRSQYDVANRMAARSLAEARASASDFRLGAAYMSYYQIAEMQDDSTTASTFLTQAVRTFENGGMLRTVPGYLSNLIKNAQSRGDVAEMCRHRENLSTVYAKIDGADVREDMAENLDAIKRANCLAR